MHTVTPTGAEEGAVLRERMIRNHNYKVCVNTYKTKGWFHVTVMPSSDSSPEHVILDTSPTPTVTRMSCLASRDERFNRPTT